MVKMDELYALADEMQERDWPELELEIRRIIRKIELRLPTKKAEMVAATVLGCWQAPIAELSKVQARVTPEWVHEHSERFMSASVRADREIMVDGIRWVYRP